jgi:very-short-patch-repair endonuclease
MTIRPDVTAKTNERARGLRQSAPKAEKQLWYKLRDRRLNGFKFVRQEQIGRFYADFCCREHRLIIEVDGATHSTDLEVERDRHRQLHLEALGYSVLRFTNDELFRNMEGVLDTILAKLTGHGG